MKFFFVIHWVEYHIYLLLLFIQVSLQYLFLVMNKYDTESFLKWIYNRVLTIKIPRLFETPA
jgi:hypothetical protein